MSMADNSANDTGVRGGVDPRVNGRRCGDCNRPGGAGADPFLGEARAMPIPAQRTINPAETRNFGRFGDAIDVPPLTDVQTRSY